MQTLPPYLGEHLEQMNADAKEMATEIATKHTGQKKHDDFNES
jgi:hypothetical protein